MLIPNGGIEKELHALLKVIPPARGGNAMRTLTTIAATLGVIGAIAVGSAVPATAWYGYHHHYYHHRHYGYHHHYYHHRYYAYYPRYHHHHHWYRY